MNKKLTLSDLSKALASDTGHTVKQCEDFLRELFSICGESLAAGEDVKVRGLGVFRIVEVGERKSVNVASGEEFMIPAHKKVNFVPESRLANAVNIHFGMFEPIEIPSEVATLPSEPASLSTESSRMPTESYAFDEAKGITEAEEDEGESVNHPEKIVNNGELLSTPESSVVSTDETHEQTEVSEEAERVGQPQRNGCRFCWGVVTGFVAACVLGGIGWLIYTFLHDYSTTQDDTNEIAIVDSLSDSSFTPAFDEVVSSEENNSDSAINSDESESAEVATNPSDIKYANPSEVKEDNSGVEDVISTTRYLTTMAREHYGNDAFWPYIYEENKSFLRHPDRIRPGTKVIVPPLSKYGVDPKNPAHIRKAKNLGVEIYSRYKK